MTEWINPNDDMPEDQDKILVVGTDGVIHAGTFYEGPDKFAVSTGSWYASLEDFLYWMPIPKPPEL